MRWAFWLPKLTREQMLAKRFRRVAARMRERYSGDDDMFEYPHSFRTAHARAQRLEEAAAKLDAGELSYDQAIEAMTVG